MEGLLFLYGLCGTMFVGSYMAGCVPLVFNFAESKIRMASVFGAGLLIGTAFSVIIPEGLEALYEPVRELHPVDVHAMAANAILKDDSVLKVDPNDAPRLLPENLKAAVDGDANAKAAAPSADAGGVHETVVEHLHSQNEEHVASESGHKHAEGSAHVDPSSTGLPLVLGFLFMLLVDQITKSSHAGARSKLTATVGLVVHAAADGIALGSAFGTNKLDVQMVVFLAIMLHKAPAAFALVSFLVLEGLEKFRVRKHLLAFSLAAPIGTLITYYVLSTSGGGMLSSSFATGVLMLFSAGTFIYVSTVHILPELQNAVSHTHMPLGSPTTTGHTSQHFNARELFLLILGALCPTFLSAGHSH
ncbi:ZIP Zinc transporter [Aphelenchoides avenae]|nr:ZIP Zinc transporter [Aphelenchus avenae]